jgi:hypothetical protein
LSSEQTSMRFPPQGYRYWRKKTKGGACTSQPSWALAFNQRAVPVMCIEAGRMRTLPNGEQPSVGLRICRNVGEPLQR